MFRNDHTCLDTGIFDWKVNVLCLVYLQERYLTLFKTFYSKITLAFDTRVPSSGDEKYKKSISK